MSGRVARIRGRIMLAASSLAILAGGQAQAQQVAGAGEIARDDQATAAEPEIVVTGSRIATGTPVGATATVLGRQDIVASGAVTIDRVIRELPQVFDLGVSENSRAQSGGSGNIVYGNTINLRGIGPYATLVLIDGHRVVNNSRSVDPSVLPTLGVERVEVVANGASAIYGSDAVAGVVNLIPRRRLDGVEAFARYNTATQGGWDEWAAGAAFGTVFEGGQLMVAYEHVERSRLSGDDRDYFTSDQRRFGGNDYRVTNCAPGTLFIGNTSYALPAQYTPANAGAITPGTSNLCEGNPGQDLIPQQKYDSVNATASLAVTNGVELKVDGFYSRREFDRIPNAIGSRLTVPQTNAFFVRPPGFTGTSYNLGYSFINDAPLDTSSGFAESWQVSPSVEVSLPYQWSLDALISYGETRDYSGSTRGVDNAALNAALASSNPATAFDPYGLGRTQQGVLDNIFDQVFLAPTNGELLFMEAGISGPLFTLPGGEVKLALGYERQDFEVALGNGRGAATNPIVFREFGRTVDSGYAELLVPLFGPDNATGGIRSLDLTAAVRHDKYSDAGSTTNPQFGIDWEPIDDVKLRASYGTSFRAPTIPEIYGNSNALFGQQYQNPAGGAPLLGYTLAGPNLDLGPETATTWSVGADVDPTDSLRLSVTYFSVEYENQVIGLLSNLGLLAQEAQYAGTPVIFRGQAARDRVAAALAAGLPVLNQPIPGGDINNVNLFVDGRGLNLGRSITRGIDFNASWSTDLGPDDRVGLNLSGTYLTEYSVAVAPEAELVKQLNVIFQPLRFRGRFVATWDHGPFTFRTLATHVGGYTNNQIQPSQQVEAFTPVDLTLTWRVRESYARVPGGLELTAEVRNLFDDDPPFVNIAPSGNGSGGYDATAANPIGRQVAISARVSF